MADRAANPYMTWMPTFTTDLPWQQIAIYAAGAALIVIAVAVRLRRDADRAPGHAAPAPDEGTAAPGVRRTR